MKRILLALSLALPFFAAAQQSSLCQHSHQLTERAINDPALQASNLRSDTIDILDYSIALDITDFTTDTIRGYTDVQFTPLMNNVSVLDLDLLQLTIDSIRLASTPLTYTYDDTLLKITLPFTHNPGDTSTVRVYYHGKPQGDPSGWGGFYFSSGYAFNLGVGFGAVPHNYGRVWFPCFDNFVERSTYTFAITTSNGKIASCNGMLVSDTTIGQLRTRTFRLDKTIPSYLAMVAVAPYTQVNQTFNSVLGPVPIVLYAVPADTTPLKNSFLHLTNALSGSETRYGPYRWPKVGYTLVPFSSGAMEHATNISYPKPFVNGLLTYEAELMAHELSHHWWGDLATCRTADDMWLNEGWASYSQHVFTEWVYGHAAYMSSIRTNHENVLHNTHVKEQGFRAVSGIPDQYTYGDHVYLKGADVAHTLRGYMGDSLFWPALQYHLNQNQYKDVSSTDFMNDLIASSGMSTLTDFFNGWVFNGGWPHFSIDSFAVTPNGQNYDVLCYFKQKLDGAPAYFNNVPLDVTFKNSNWNSITQRFVLSGQYTQHTFTLPFNPSYAAIDFDEKISDAIADEWKVLNATGTYNMTLARCYLTVNAISDSALFRVEHNFAPPDSIRNNTNHYRISDYRYWTIDGLLPSTFDAKAKFYYDGRTTIGANGNLDNGLTVPNGDSIILLYRRNAADNWHEYPHYTKTIIGTSSTSKYGYVNVDSLKLGQYAFANGVSTVLIGINEPKEEQLSFNLFPNPAEESAMLQWEYNTAGDEATITVFDMSGRIIGQEKTSDTQLQLNTADWAPGMYFVQVRTADGMMNQKLIVR